MTEKNVKIAVIVPTLHRSLLLKNFLASLKTQTIQPSVCVIVDQSDNDKTKVLFQDTDLNKIEKVYIHQQERSLLKARNNGIRNCGDVDFICFFDDDVTLSPDYLEILVKILQNDLAKKYAGCMGTIDNIVNSKSFISKVFMLPHMGSGMFMPNGMPTFPHCNREASETEFVSGGMSMYRADILKSYMYDDKMVGYGYGDDIDLCYRITRKYKFYYEPKAKIHQVDDVPGRDPGIKHRKGQLQNIYYLTEKNIGLNFKTIILMLWTFIGFTLEDLVRLKRSAFLGDLLGIWNVLFKRIDTIEGYQKLK